MPDIIKYLLDPMEDERLTSSHIDYEMWHYIMQLEAVEVEKLRGFALPDSREGYATGLTPRRYVTESSAKMLMQLMDNQAPFTIWFNNHSNDPSALQNLLPLTTLQVTKDEKGFLLQCWSAGTVYRTVRFDRRAPNPPGWKE